ncbi:MAG: DNA primase [Planctomycetota bacterium]|nr:DNA primase [Planctomycetota bacterium]
MAGVFDQAIVTRIQQANDIVDVISEHVSLKKKGREMVGLCPFHDDHRPSFNVNVAKQIFKCFACGAGGDVFKFVQMRENLTFPQAIERLAERAGIKLERRKPTSHESRTASDEIDPNRLAKVNAWAANYFQENLHDQIKGQKARDYINARQISPESTKKWQLGLAIDSPDDLIRAAKAKNIPAKLLDQAGLTAGLNQDKFVNRLMFPISDVTGRFIGFGGRTLDQTGAKYINSPTTALFDKSNCLYGLDQARHQIAASETAVVVEGYTDCIMAHQSGCSNIVATLGTSFTTGHARILRRYAKKVVLVFDSDTAGIEAANRALEVCLSQRIDIKLASVPQGKDPCDFLLVAGKERFEKLLEQATDVFQFKWNRLIASFGSDDTLAGRKLAVEEFLQTIATSLWAGNLPVIDRALVVSRLSKIIGIDSKDINTELAKRMSRVAKSASYNTQDRKVQSIDWGQGLSAIAQREILEVLLNEPKLFEAVKQKITPEVFDVPILRQIAAILFEALDTDPGASLKDMLAGIESVDVSNCLTELASAGEEKGNFQPRLTGAMNTLAGYYAQKKKSQMKTITGDQTKFLRDVYENTGKQNPRNMGMT